MSVLSLSRLGLFALRRSGAAVFFPVGRCGTQTFHTFERPSFGLRESRCTNLVRDSG